MELHPGRQPNFGHAHTRANHAAGLDAKQKLQEIAARDLGGRPEDYETSDGRVYRRSNPSQGMTLGRAATRAIELGGRYSGEEFNDDLNDMTKASVTGVGRPGSGGGGEGQFWRRGRASSGRGWSASPRWSWTYRDGCGRCGALTRRSPTAVVVLHPRSLGAQVLGGSIQGMGIAMSQKWVFDPVWGVSFAKRLYTARPPGILDVPIDMQWAAVETPGSTDSGRRERDRRTLLWGPAQRLLRRRSPMPWKE